MTVTCVKKVDGNIFEAAIDKLATAGVRRGCDQAEVNRRLCATQLCDA